MAARKKYREFHGFPHRYERDIIFHVPRSLIRLGRVVAIEYECDKENGGGDGTTAVYRHEFEHPASLNADEKMRNQLYLIGDKVTVKSPGIMG